MLSWIAGFVGRWAGRIDQDVRDLVHWTVHALASVVYTVFGHVGRAWHEVFAAANWLRESAWRFVQAVYWHIATIVLHDIPAIYDWAKAGLTRLLHYAEGVLAWAARAVAKLETLAWGWIKDVRSWAIRDIWNPLFSIARQLRADLIKWGYTAWWWVTHPDKLAEALFWYLVGLLERNAWAVAGQLGRFLTALVWSNRRRFIALLEEVLHEVL